jgi:heptosyltransferase-2
MIPVIKFKRWTKPRPPRKILVMRFQAIGDTIITFPYLQDLHDKSPGVVIDFLTRRESAGVARQLPMFHRVFEIGGGRNAKVQFVLCLAMLPFLWVQRYDAVIDLQHHRISRLLRRLLRAPAWSEFDRTSPLLAGIRTQATINALGLAPVGIAQSVGLREERPAEHLLNAFGWNSTSSFIILNPAGAFATREWPLENYVAFARRWLEYDDTLQFVLLGLASMKIKAAFFKQALGSRLIDLTGQTTMAEAYAIVRRAKLMVSEDSGLMHMAWTQRIPTVALLGSTPAFWSAPLGEWTRCFNSGDLPCGNCSLKVCRFGDNHCMTRLAPQTVFKEALELIDSINLATRTSR